MMILKSQNIKGRSKMKNIYNSIKKHWDIRPQSKYNEELTFSKAVDANKDLNFIYSYMLHHFHNRCPQIIREHRIYFDQEQRGFGEDAFHAMWWLLMIEFKPEKCLEIGVYRGQIISLWSLIAKTLNLTCEVHGISPFSPLGDSVSRYPKNINYQEDVINSFNHFELSHPTLIKSLSTETDGIDHINNTEWDLIYIDGSHDFDNVLADYNLCKNNLAPGGIIVFDDAGLWTEYNPSSYSFAGHSGPSRVAQEHALKEMILLGVVGHNVIFQKKPEVFK